MLIEPPRSGLRRPDRGSMTHAVPELDSDDPKYAVILVTESQLEGLLRRQPMRSVGPRLLTAGRPFEAARRRRRLGLAAGLVAIGALAGAWYSSPRPGLASIVPGKLLTWTRTPMSPPLLTGASFSVAVASPRPADAAGVVLGRIQEMGLPGFAEAVPGSSSHQVMVGPYASLDEAEAMLSRLARAGFAGPRLAVDERLRGGSRDDFADAIPGDTGVLLIGAGNRVSLVLELPSAPQQVVAQQVDETTIDVDVAPVAYAVAPREWSAPSGVHLVEHVSIEEGPVVENERALRARLTVPTFARASARVEGRRVYVDLTWPEAAVEPTRPRPRPSRASTPERPAASRPAAAASAPAPAASMESLRAAMTRFGEIMPFVVSAAASGEPEILGALDGTLATLAGTLQNMRVPSGAAATHGLLISAVTTARKAVDPAATGDRVALAHQAMGLFESARAGVN